MLLQLGDRQFKVVALEELTLLQVARFQQELATADLVTSARTWSDVRRIHEELRRLPQKERGTHPEGVFMTGVLVWAAQAAAGGDVSLLEAIDHPLSEIAWIREPGDPVDDGPGEGEGKARRPSGSGAGKRRKSKSRK